MRKTLTTFTVLALLAAMAFFSERVAATPLQGTYNRDQIASACGSAGGRYYSNLDGYGCFKENCNGKGGLCAVVCENSGKCDGSTPQKVVSGKTFKNLRAVLGTLSAQPAKSTSGPPAGGLLDTRPAIGTSTPSASGTPIAPSPPPGPVLR